jgi:O-antigen/teichoic acid export membrane protein
MSAVTSIVFSLDLLGFSYLYLASNLITGAISYIILIRFFFKPKLIISWTFVKETIPISIPFGLTAFFTLLFNWIGSSLILIYEGKEAVGWYNAALRLAQPILLIVIVIGYAVFPVMSQLYVSSKKSLNSIFQPYLIYVTIIGFYISFTVTFMSSDIIILFFGEEYKNSILILQIIIWSTAFLFVRNSFANLLGASDRQNILALITGFCVILNLGLNLILIGYLGYIGVAITNLITISINLFLVVYFSVSRKYVQFTRITIYKIVKLLISNIFTWIIMFFIMMFTDFNNLIASLFSYTL